ncbi:MAG: DUF2147 domain-containing protein [Caulobacteraceae bacterium]
MALKLHRAKAAAGAALVFLALATAANGDTAASVVGRWRTAQGDGLVEIRPCGSWLCGYLLDHVRLRRDPGAMDIMNAKPEMRTRPMMDLLLLDHFEGGPKEWRKGAIYNPETGKTYSGVLNLLDAARLKVTGCLVRPLCGSQVWKRER